MASSRESSPASEAGTSSPAQLTPNSKVKAMLAALDKDSDDESVSGSARARFLSTIATTTSDSTETARISEAAIRTETSLRGTMLDDFEDDEEEDIVRPKGRMAARMLVEENKSEEDEPAADDARERVRKMLMAKSKSPEPAANPEDGDGSGEEDAPVATRKRKIRVPRRETPKSSPTKAPASPALFVSPQPDKVASPSCGASDSEELPENPGTNDRFLALVAKKREERLAREAELAREKAKKATERKRHSSLLEEDDQFDDSDDNVERRLTQQSRPSRKASKRALEEMQRETQRLSRNQQLAHHAVTKKKITIASLFAKFDYKPAGHVEEETPESSPPTSSSSAAPQSDMEMKDTPPTSPAPHEEENVKLTTATTLPVASKVEQDAEDELPSIEEVLNHINSSPPRSDKGKRKAIEEPTAEPQISKQPTFTQRPIRVRPLKMADRKVSKMDDSDSDLEIVTTTPVLKKNLESIFDRVPAKQAKESHPIHVLRMFANLTSPGNQNTGLTKKPSMTTTELQASLQQRARQQAIREREERLQALRDKGIIVQTAEERERETADVDDLLAKARHEDEELMKREKAAAKKERKDRGEVDPLGESSDDEDWEEVKEDIPEELSVSGSDDEMEMGSGDEVYSGEEEEEEEDGDELMAVDGENAPSNPMFDNEAAESDGDESEAHLFVNEEIAEDGDVDEDEEEQGQELPIKQKPRRTRNPNVISDDEDGDEDIDAQPLPQQPQTESPVHLHTESPMAPNSVLRSATKTFIPGLTVAGPAGLGLTQIFAGTMDESQIDPFKASSTAQNGSEKNSMAFLRQLPPPELPPFVPTMAEDTQDAHMNNPSQLSQIPESQPMDSETQAETQGIELNFSQSQIHGFDSLVQDTQLSQFPEATQDAGFQHMTPIRGRFVDAPPSTVDTVMLDPTAVPETTEETPIVKKKGKLRRRIQVASFSDDEEAADQPGLDVDEDEFDITSNAFDVMRKASKKRIVVGEFDKKKSKAKEMVNEQAEESEDEYAGLGGASDDESGEEDAYVKEIIDDEGGKDVDESKLAAFFADRERASDEKQVEKLYKDITNGMLRRKRGAEYDLSDSDDGGEARRRMKRKEFAKMRKALLADERIGKIAENPKRQAFLRAIEDRGSGDEMDFLDDFAEQEETTDSQSQGEGSQQIIPDSQPTAIGPPKRKRSDEATEAENRPPPHLRRTKPATKPSNLSEIRESLSSLIEEPNAVISQADSGSDTGDELEIEGAADLGSRKENDKENRDPFALRRKSVPIIDRISLKRAASNTVSSSARLAFATSSSTLGFKVPPLLRRATTNNSLASSTSSSVSGGMSATERMAGGSGGSDGVKRGGGKNSGVHYFARESERRAAVVKTEKRREQKLVKGAQVRRKVVGGLFGGGKFE